MELSTFANKNTREVVPANFQRTVRIQGTKFNVELASFCWLEDRNLTILVSGALGEGRFRSPRRFKEAKLSDLEKLIGRIKKLNICHVKGCRQRYLVHDYLRKENPNGFCERHRILDLQDRKKRIYEKREFEAKSLKMGDHDAIVQTGGMQDDETTQEALYVYAKRIAEAIKGRKNIKNLFEDIYRNMGEENDARSVLGVADYLLKKGVKLDKGSRTYVLECIDDELKPTALSDWFNRRRRRNDLNAFRRTVLHEKGA